MPQYYIYILQSKKDDSYYIGYTSDISKRLERHNTQTSGYTSRKQPWKIVYQEEYSEKSVAIKRERFLKRQKNRSFYERLINGKTKV